MTLVEAMESAIHRDYVRVKPRETTFLRNADLDASIQAFDAAYRAWAHARNLEARPGEHRFTGRFWGRSIAFFTGLSGSAPISAEIVIEALLPIDDNILIQREASSDADKTQARTLGLVLVTVFGSEQGRYVRSVAVTPRGLRVRLEPLVPPAEIDALLDVLFELVSSLACLAVPTSTSDSTTLI